MEGKVPSSVFALQRRCTPSAQRHLAAASWAKGFITRLLHLSHSQWIYRNVSLHDLSNGYLRRKKRRDMLRDIARLLETPSDEVPEECRFLLEVDHAALEGASLDRQAYWVLAVEAAKGAGRVAVSPRAGRRQAATRGGTSGRRSKRQRFICSPQLKRALGGLEVEQEIQRDFGHRPRRVPRKQSGAGDDLTMASNKRRRPD